MNTTINTELAALNSVAELVERVAKGGALEGIDHCKAFLTTMLEDNDGSVFPIAPNVYVHLLEAVEKVETIRKRQPVETVKAEPVAIADGTYTIVEQAGHWTFRVKTLTKGSMEGKTIVEFLSGPDNELDFTGFGFLNADGTVKVWGRFGNSETVQAKARAIESTFRMGEGEGAGERYALVSGRCRRCNRKLTVPASIHRGYGPECAERV